MIDISLGYSPQLIYNTTPSGSHAERKGDYIVARWPTCDFFSIFASRLRPLY